MSQSLVDTLNEARRRVLAGEELTIEEQRRYIQMLRDARGTVPTGPSKSKSKSKSKASAAPISDDDLFADLEKLGL